MVSMLLSLVDYSPIVMMTQCAIYPIVHFGDYLLATSLNCTKINKEFYISNSKYQWDLIIFLLGCEN